MSNKLIDILDNYRSKQTIKYKEYSTLLNVMNYDYFDNNLFSSTFSGRIPIRQNEDFLLRDAYSMWKQTYEIDISLNDIVKPVEPIIKTHVHIDVKISSLSDL